MLLVDISTSTTTIKANDSWVTQQNRSNNSITSSYISTPNNFAYPIIQHYSNPPPGPYSMFTAELTDPPPPSGKGTVRACSVRSYEKYPKITL